VALVVDGKTFADDTMVVALGITLAGTKRFVGFVQTGTENDKVLSFSFAALRIVGWTFPTACWWSRTGARVCSLR